MSDLETLKALARWKAKRRNRWLLVVLVIFLLSWGFVGIVSMIQYTPVGISWLTVIGMLTALVGWLIGSVIGIVYLIDWASKA